MAIRVTLCEICGKEIDSEHTCKCGFDACREHGHVCRYCKRARK